MWEALDLMGELREYEAGLAPAAEGLDPGMPLRQHALQVRFVLEGAGCFWRGRGVGGGGVEGGGGRPSASLSLAAAACSVHLYCQSSAHRQTPTDRQPAQVAELCRLAFPDKEWLALVGLLHGLGKLLAHPAMGAQPQWAVAGETYPLGCRFDPQVGHSELFSANPDRRRRAFASPDGVYAPGCGLKEVYMSWGAPEYLYLVMVLNQVALPEEALFILRCAVA